MKKFLFLSVAVLFLLVTSCKKKERPVVTDPPALGKLCTLETIVEAKEPGTYDTIRFQYVCDELVVRGASLDFENYLREKGYKPVKKCHCNPDLEVWSGEGATINPIGVVDDPPPSNNDGSMSLNIIMSRSILHDSLLTVDPDNILIPGQPEPPGNTVIVGMVDTGIDFEQDPGFLLPFLWNGRSKGCCEKTDNAKYGLDMIDFSSPKDQQGHGTHCSGIIAGYGERNSGGFTTELLPVSDTRIEIVTAKVSEDSRNAMTLFDATCGIHYVLKQDAKVVNLSWGFLEPGKINHIGTSTYYPYVMVDAIEEAREKGAVIVTSAGNDEREIIGNVKFWPACFALEYDHVLSVEGTVAANDPTLDISYSNRIPGSFRAPGTRIISPVPKFVLRLETENGPLKPHHTNGWGMGTGTSMSAAFITRYVALLYGKRPPAPGESVKAFLQARGAETNVDPNRWLTEW